MSDQDITLAAAMLRGNQRYIDDAREGAPVGNSVVGSLLNLMHQVPRQNAEAAVLEALRVLDAEARAEATEHVLTRSGQAPLRFAGELLAESDGERQAGREQNRWHELAVYRTTAGKYVLRIGYRTRWQGELDRDVAEIVDEPGGVAEALQHYYPCAPVAGYPPGAGYEDRQARLLADIRRRYDAQVSELLASAPEFAEEIP